MSKKMTKEELYAFVSETYTGDATSALSEAEQRYLAMIRGEKPRNKSEAIMQQEIIQMKKEGKIIDIPSM